IIAAASAANADPELAAAPVVVATAPKAAPAVAPAAQQPYRADASEPDDEDSQAEVDKSAAELEAVRKAEEKAGLLPAAPGTGPRDGLAVELGGWDPVARDLALAQGASLDGTPLADPAPAGGAQARLPELAGITEEELRAKYDIPVELNDAVVAYIRFFQTDAREHFSRWLGRSTKWLPSMRVILDKQGVPVDLVYLSMIE